MFTAAEMAELREIAESTMLDTFEAYATTTGKVDGWDTTTRTLQYETPGEIAGSSQAIATTTTRTVDIGGLDHVVIEGGLSIPIGPLERPVPRIGWQFKCVAVADGVGDPANVGRWWQVVEIRSRGLATKRRLDVVEISDPTVEPEDA